MNVKRGCAMIVVAASFLGFSPSATAEEWGWGIQLFSARLREETYGGGYTTDDLFEGGGGFDMHASYAWTPFMAQTLGFNSVGFDGDFSSIGSTTVKTDAIAAGALYTGLEMHTEGTKGWGFYGRLEIGVSRMDDVKHSVTQNGVARGVEKSLDGGSDFYTGFGFGAAYGWTERWGARLGVMWRRYGTLESASVPGHVVPVEDVDVMAGGLEFGVLYWF